MLTYHHRPATLAREPLPAVSVQRAVEIPRLTIDIDVQGIKGCPTLGNRLGHHLTSCLQQLHSLALAEARARGLRVTTNPPQGFVGINVADTGYQCLVEQAALDGRPACAQSSRNLIDAKGILEGIRGDVGDWAGHIVNQRGESESAEGALIQKT